MSRRTGCAVAAMAVALLLLCAGMPAAAQERGAGAGFQAVVEQIAGSTIYVPAGRDHGLAAGDTLRAYRAPGDPLLGLLVVVGVSERRAALTFATAPFRITRGDALRLEPLRPGESGEVAGPVVAAPAAEEPVTPTESGRPLRTAISPAAGAQLHGTLGVEMDAFRATTRWGGPGVAPVERRVTTPTVRLQATAAGLPLGLEARANVRGAYRSAAGSVYGPAHSLRVYEASVARSFTGVPVEARVGRFHTRSSSLRSFWDGGMVRVGREGWGLGVAAGFEPARGDEGFSADIEKWSVFADYRHRGDRLSYTSDIRFLNEQSQSDGWSRRTLGWGQRARWRRLFVSHRLELDLDPGEGDVLRRAFADLGLAIAGGFRLDGGFARDAARWRIPTPAASPPPAMERWSVGASWAGSAATMTARVGRIREGNARAARSVDGALHLRPLGRSGLAPGLAAAYWSSDGLGSLFVSPSLARSFGSFTARVGYQYYRSEGADPPRLHGIDAAADIPVRRALSAGLAAQGQWGSGVTTLRTYAGLRLHF